MSKSYILKKLKQQWNYVFFMGTLIFLQIKHMNAK